MKSHTDAMRNVAAAVVEESVAAAYREVPVTESHGKMKSAMKVTICTPVMIPLM